MQKITSLLFAFCLAAAVSAQSPCLPDGIGFFSAQEIADFASNYPGCTDILGDVYIETSGPDLHGLEMIRSIGGNLQVGLVEGNPNFVLTSFQGLNNLRSIGGNFSVEKNPNLLDFQGLDSLRVVGGNLRVWNNNVLSSLHGLSHLDSIGGYLSIKFNAALGDLSGLDELTTLGKYLLVENNGILHDLNGLQQLSTVGGNIALRENGGLENIAALAGVSGFNQSVILRHNTVLTSLDGLQNLGDTLQNILLCENTNLKNIDSLYRVRQIVDTLFLYGCPALHDLKGLRNVTGIGRHLEISDNHGLKDLTGLDSLRTVGQYLQILNNDSLLNLKGLDALQSVENMFITGNISLLELKGLEQAQYSSLGIGLNFSLTSLAALQHLHTLPVSLTINGNSALTSLAGLDSLESVGELLITQQPALQDLTGLGALKHLYRFTISFSSALTSLHGLESLAHIDDHVAIALNPLLNDISALSNVDSIGSLFIIGSPDLHSCATAPICALLAAHPERVSVTENGVGCNTPAEVETECESRSLLVRVLVDTNHDCVADAGDVPAESILVQLDAAGQQVLRSTGSNGIAYFAFPSQDPLLLSLPHFPDNFWQVCQDTLSLLPGAGPDTLYAVFLLNAPVPCPAVTVDLGLPNFFRGCLVPSSMQINARNPGGGTAEAVLASVILPGSIHLVSSIPPPSAQSGDTLRYALGDLEPLHQRTVHMVVKTDCNADLIDRTLCVEAFVKMENPCPTTPLAFSEIRLFSQCLGDTMVRFIVKNVGDAPTLAPHTYTIFRNADFLLSQPFNLAAQQSIFVDLPADGATYRMEATKYNSGALTATALEGCGGFTPGQITPYWLEEGLRDYDFDCREVRVAYDPNQKTAIPGGVGSAHLLPADRPIRYTIDFQNTGTDTAFRVLLRDVLAPQLDFTSFRPGASTHPYTWQIEGDTLEVLFSPIALPDSNVNEAASHGWFSFDIDQKPNLPDGTVIQNTASIIFDYNPPIVTNTVWHTIGKLTVSVDEPAEGRPIWQVMGNPARETATFRSVEMIPGVKRFELADALGRVVRTEHFDGQTFEFQRGRLPGGVYVFRIWEAGGRGAAGKILLGD